IKTEIIKAWQDYFVVLKQDLATGHFTVDNAKNNTTMMEHLELLLAMRKLPIEFNAADRRIMCFPHIMNICIQHVCDEFLEPNLVKLAEAWVDGFNDNTVDKDSYLNAVKKNPVALGCSIVRMDNAEWFILKDYEVILDVPHFIQQQMSSESRPVLSCTIPCFKLFMTIWEKHARANKHIAPFINVGLHWANIYYNRMDNTTAYIVAM
ncbi:hypothetical protein BU15DRAFT_31483, partial [Melanogaster broomeanus]